MIRLRDATILAFTKLRTRRIRTTITVVISGLLFSSLIAALLVSQGAVRSLRTFNNIGLGSRYIVQAIYEPFIGNIIQNQDIINRAQALYNQTVSAKQSAAKKLGLDYDPTSEEKPTQAIPGASSSQVYLNPTAPSSLQAINEYLASQPQPSLPDLKQIASSYHAESFYTASNLGPVNGTLTTMTNGIEDFNANTTALKGAPTPTDPLNSAPLTLMPDSLTQPFLLPHATTQATANEIPIIAPYSIATQLLGLSNLPGNASPAQKLNRIKELYARAATISFSACYRNNVSEQQIQDAISTAADIAAHAKDKTYQKPPLIYGLPAANSCGPAPVISDTRTSDQKQQDKNQTIFDNEFGIVDAPDQQKITFHVVGLVPDQPSGAPSNSAAGIFQSLVGSSLQGVLAVPQDAYAKLPSAARYNQLLTAAATNPFVTNNTYYAEFSTADQARSLIDTKSCSTAGGCGNNKPFLLNAYGSDSIALQDLQRKFGKIFRLGALGVVVLAAIIMTGTIGRMIADGRRETAIFRAIGAERIDISIVYTLYALGLSLLVGFFALVVGWLAAYAADRYFWQTATVHAQLAFGGNDTAIAFHFFAYTMTIWLVVAGAAMTGLVSMLLPLARNVRRNPINDMRDE